MKIVVHPGCSLVLLGDARGVSVDCLGGELWITQERDSQDHIVARGGHFAIDRRGRVVISSLLEAEVVLRGQGRSLLGLPLWRARLVLTPRNPEARQGDARAGKEGRAA